MTAGYASAFFGQVITPSQRAPAFGVKSAQPLEIKIAPTEPSFPWLLCHDNWKRLSRRPHSQLERHLSVPIQRPFPVFSRGRKVCGGHADRSSSATSRRRARFRFGGGFVQRRTCFNSAAAMGLHWIHSKYCLPKQTH